MAGSMSIWKQAALSLAIGLIVAGAWYQQDTLRAALGLAAESPGDRAGGQRRGGRSIPVIVTRVGTGEDAIEFVAVGTGRAQRSVMLRSEDSGKVVSMELAPGKRFKAGDVLMRLDVAEQQLAVELARTRKEQADRIFRRFEQLRQSGNAAAARLDEVKSAAEIARIELDQALEAQEKRYLRAPFDGVSGLASVEEGARVSTETDIASFDDRSVLLVEFDLPEALLGRVREGMPVKATTPSSPKNTYDGTVVALDSRIVASSRTAKARVAIENEGDELRPGASFTVTLQLPGKTYPLVPELAVQFSRGTLHVWRIRDEKAEQVEIAMIRRQSGAVLVDGPLEAGDLVVVEGTQRLDDGAAVTVLDQEGGTPDAAPST